MSDKRLPQQPTIGDELKALIDKYLRYEQNISYRRHIQLLVEQNDLIELTRLIGRRLTFGTAGLRGLMGPGFGQMNDLVIIQTSQGLASYLLKMRPAEIKKKGIIIGFDARHNSDRFARLSALAFLQKEIPVYYCDHIIATPLVAYGVKHYGCLAGIVVTASHNPKDDNGYKVYGQNGAQILSPHDKHIQEHIIAPENQEPWSMAWRHELLQSPLFVNRSKSGSSTLVAAQQAELPPKQWEELLFWVYSELSESYFAYLKKIVGSERRRRHNGQASISITYTAMHGVGHKFLSRALDIAGFENVNPVELQMEPDPDFPSVKFPNPEEAGALDLAYETARSKDSNLILAVDPDADRCAAALYDPESGHKRVFNGNEIGALLGWWIWHCYMSDNTGSTADTQQITPGGSSSQQTDIKRRKPADCYMISTAVSSKFLQSMAQVEGFQFVETLTGFKYMGNLTDDLINKQNKKVLFAFEEAIGYMVDSTILDKDGISAAIQVAQCSAYVARNYHRTLEQQLDWLYTAYGYHYSLNSYYVCSNPATISEIFGKLQSNYPTKFGDTNEFCVKRVRDLNNGYDSGTADKKAILPTSSSSFMVTFFIGDNITFTIRTSGTEPKIKYYSEIVAQLEPIDIESTHENKSGSDLSAAKGRAQNKLQDFIRIAIQQCLEPLHHGLQPAQ